jgi:hypothetical protein
MKARLLIMMLLTGSSMFAATRFFIGFGFGGYTPPPVVAYAPPPPPPVVAYYPPAPRPGYVYVRGYWYPSGPRYAWRAGYWARPPYRGAHWVAPRYHGRRYYPGYWRR